jgi:hypothetical protein
MSFVAEYVNGSFKQAATGQADSGIAFKTDGTLLVGMPSVESFQPQTNSQLPFKPVGQSWGGIHGFVRYLSTDIDGTVYVPVVDRRGPRVVVAPLSRSRYVITEGLDTPTGAAGGV